MKKHFFLGLCALLLGATAAFAQFPGFRQQPITNGMKDTYKDYFMIGVAVNNRNVTDPDQMALIKREFNSITAENAMKPQPTEPEKGVFNWEEADRIANFCREPAPWASAPPSTTSPPSRKSTLHSSSPS